MSISNVSPDIARASNIIFITNLPRYVVHAEVEEVRIFATTGHEGFARRETLLHVPFEPEEQSAEV